MSKPIERKARSAAACTHSVVAATTLAVSVLGSPTAIGETAAYTDESAFLAAATPIYVESFEDELVTDHVPSLVTTYFAVQITPLSGDYSGILIGDSPGWASDGIHYLGGGGGPNPWRMDFTLDFPVYAIAFDVMSASEATTQTGGTSVVRIDLPTGEKFVMSSCPPCLQSPGFPGHADYFFGIVSDTPFSSFSIVNTAFGDGVAFDRMQFVPDLDPAAMLRQLLADVTDVGPGKSLADKVALARTYYAVPDLQATCAVLTDLVDEVRAQRDKRRTQGGVCGWLTRGGARPAAGRPVARVVQIGLRPRSENPGHGSSG